MTAILGILNKTAVALAADSAATLTGPRGEKIYNNAHKLFTLSHHYPVGLMVCNSAELSGISWEILIKIYRKQLNTGYDYLPDYASDFMSYIQEHSSHQLEIDDLKVSMLRLAADLTNYLFQKVVESWQVNAPPAEADLNEVANTAIREQYLPLLLENFNAAPIINRDIPYLYSDFKEEFEEFVKRYISEAVQVESNSSLVLDDNTIENVLELLYAYGQHEAQFDYTGSWSGLVISGYGEKDIYPQLVSYRVGPVFGGKVRIVLERQVKISSNNPSSIEPFAQTDVIQTFWSGVDPFIIDTVVESMVEVVDNVVQHIIGVTDDDGKAELTRWLTDSRPEIIQDLKFKLEKVAKTKNRQPMLDAVATLSKEDLADMAESLISLTYLKRRASLSSESVGGPVDVAIITKGEGFIWLKRKQYFRPELNLAYISSVINRSPGLAHPPTSLPSHSHE